MVKKKLFPGTRALRGKLNLRHNTFTTFPPFQERSAHSITAGENGGFQSKINRPRKLERETQIASSA